MFTHAEIQGLYLTVYNRPADWTGLLYWSDRLRINDVDHVNEAFTEAREFDEMYGGLSSTGQVAAIYDHLLGRTPDESGLEYWASRLDAGESVAGVARRVGEAAQGADGEAFASRIDAALESTYGDIMDVLYAGYYGRGADEAGRAYWIGQIREAEGDLSEVITAFGNSKEYVETYGGFSSEEQVTMLYDNLFSRKPDAEGLAYWSESLGSGTLALSSIAFSIATAASGSDLQVLSGIVEQLNSSEGGGEPKSEPEAEPMALTLSDALALGTLQNRYTLDPLTPTDAGVVTVALAAKALADVASLIHGAENAADLSLDTLFSWDVVDRATAILAAVDGGVPDYIAEAGTVQVTDARIFQEQFKTLSTLENFSLGDSTVMEVPEDSVIVEGIHEASLLAEEHFLVQALRSGHAWQGDELTYAFNDTFLDSYDSAYASGWAPAPENVRQAAHTIMAQVEQMLGVSLSHTTQALDANIRINMADLDPGTNGLATSRIRYDEEAGAVMVSSDIFLEHNAESQFYPQPGNWDYTTLVHELGHALGLKHTFEGGTTLSATDDKIIHSVMSYTPYNGNIAEFYLDIDETGYTYGYEFEAVYPDQFMVYDLAALHQLYGVGDGANTEDTFYTFNAEPFYKTIWDAGGVDTLDFSVMENPSVINLMPGAYSDINYRSALQQLQDQKEDFQAQMTQAFGVSAAHSLDEWIDSLADQSPFARLYTGEKSLGVAYGTIIENVMGGSGENTIIDNHVDNILLGGVANDTFILGAGGMDSIDGGGGRNSIELPGIFSTDVEVIAYETEPEWDWLLVADGFTSRFNNIDEISFDDAENNWLLV